jgi:hypothetical protein
MNELSHRNEQGLRKIGAIYSEKDEKQRIIAEEILNLKLKPQLKIGINMNIPGLTKKKTISPHNPTTRKAIFHMAGYGRAGWVYVNTMPNAIRFWAPFLMVLYYYYAVMPIGFQVHQHRHELNYEYETVYFKYQSIPAPYIEKVVFMA